MDVCEWLKGLGLGQYEATFRAHEIEADVLADLTEGDLEKIGLPLGPRKRLMRAIADLRSSASSAQTEPKSDARPTTALADVAERRPITVMFCDLVGSTRLAARLDAEDWRSLISAYLDAASAAATEFGGHVLKKLGDGLMVLFGYPCAQENDAERAVRAALAIQHALADLNMRNAQRSAPELAARIGLDSGPVVVDASGEVFGEAPNVAARVQTLAEAGTVVVTGSVHRQVAGLFVAEDKGAQELRGAPAPVSLYRIVRASGGGRRRGARALTLLVGRTEELELLQRRWERARSGAGQLALIVGEPGLGKSRLIEEFRTRLTETPHTWVEWSSSQLLQNTPLHPIAEWGRQRFGIDAPAEQRLADLERTLRMIGLDPAEYAPLLAPLVDIPLPPGRAASLPPEELRRRQLAAIVALVLAGARSQAVVLAVEDLHWADPTSLDLMQILAERGAQAPLLIVATARPEFRPPWSLRSHHSVISLSPLARAEVAHMVGELAQGHALSEEMIDDVNERTGGVPLFVEEVTRLLLERGDQGGAHAIPPTLQQSLAARLDRLGEAREAAQIGAVLGRSFSYALLREVAGVAEASLQTSLERLADADLMFVEGAPPQANYRFKHALIQDAAYESLLKSRRQPLHRRAAEVLRETGAEPEAIAHHFTEAGLDDLAIEWWGKAGDQALRRSAFQEAISHLGKAIAMADNAASASGHRAQLQVAYGNALIATRGYGAPETTEAFAKARESFAGDTEARDRLAVDYGLWVGAFVRGELAQMRAHADEFLDDVAARPDSPEAGVAHRAAGVTRWFAGEYGEARRHLEQALALFQPGRDDELAFRFGSDAGVTAMIFLAIVLWPLGDVARATFLVEAAQRRLAGIAHVRTLAYGKMHAAIFELIRHDHSRAAPNAAELARLAHDHDLNLWRAFGLFLDGWAVAESDAPAEGLEAMRRGAENLRQQNALVFDGLLKIALAEAEARASDLGRAVAILDEALATCDRTGHRAFEAELHRARGELLLERDPANPSPAEEALQAAITVAKRQATRSYELRAALGLARLYQSTSRPIEAHAVLAPALEGFSPIPEMPEIAEAQALLAALAETAEVKAEAARRERRFRLESSFAQAVGWSKGFAAEEAKVAVDRVAHALATGFGDDAERLAAHQPLWATSFMRGEMAAAREAAEDFLRAAESARSLPWEAAARRSMGATLLLQADLAGASKFLEEAMELADRGQDGDRTVGTGPDPGASAATHLSLASWMLGDLDRSHRLIEEAFLRAEGIEHSPTLTVVRYFAALREILRGDARATLPLALSLIDFCRDRGVEQFLGAGMAIAAWARARLEDRDVGVPQLRQALAALSEQGNKVYLPLYLGRLAEIELTEQGPDAALSRIEQARALALDTGQRIFDAFLERLHGEALLGVDPADARPAESAFLTSLELSLQQGARAFGLQAALALAKLYQSTARSADAHAVLAPALEGFSPTPQMPEIAEAGALLAALAETTEVKADAAQRQRRLQLQVAYGNALIAARGYGAPETTEAFAKARGVAGDSASERLAADFGLWVGAYLRGELDQMRALAATFLADASAAPNSPEAGVAERTMGVMHTFAGQFRVARPHFERSLALFEPGRDDDLAFRFGHDSGVGNLANSAICFWILGEVERGVDFINRAEARCSVLSHAATRALGISIAAIFFLMRGDRSQAAVRGAQVADLARQHDLPMWRAFAAFFDWGDESRGSGRMRDSMRRGLELLRAQNFCLYDGLLKSALAEEEAEAGNFAGAIEIVDDALASSARTGQRTYDAELHRLRGEMLLRREPGDPKPAQEALEGAILVAREQGARSFELRAARSLAKLYRSTGRPIDAHAVLAPALEGFSPTPEMPEIAEAQALLAALQDIDEVKVEVVRRRRMTQLQAAYGAALISARGYGARETREAFARARQSAAGDTDAGELLAVDYGLWAGSYVGGELPAMRTHAAAFMHDVEARPDSSEAGIAHRVQGMTHYFAGEFIEAVRELERALALFEPGRDDELAVRFPPDPGAAAMIYLAFASWAIGEAGRAVSFVERARARVAELSHTPTLAHGSALTAFFALMLGDPLRARTGVSDLARAVCDHDLPLFRAIREFLVGWATFDDGALADGLESMRRGAESIGRQNAVVFDGIIKIALADAEVCAGDPERALAVLDEALATCDRTDYRAFECEIHRARGKLLLERDPADLPRAEDAFQTAIALAKRQGARGYQLLASLSLAKLYIATGRGAAARAALRPALDGFAPTPEMPEIAEAQALLAALDSDSG